MIPITQKILDEMVLAIVNEVQPERIILFGSLARGDATQDSDIDLMVVEQEGFAKRSRWQEQQRIRKRLAHFPMAKDILVYSQDEVAQWCHSINHIVTHAMNEGKVLYEKH
ncbi:MAG: nucleotidyltransferase domain-containing protein [Magnetococcus sp. YQC-5]